jgi:hypothetical protein
VKLEKYESGGHTWIKVGIAGVLESRLKIVTGRFLHFITEPELGWCRELGLCRIAVQGIKDPVFIRDAWVIENPPLIEGEMITMLLDQIDFTAWKVERAEVNLSETAEEIPVTTLQQTMNNRGTEVTTDVGLEQEEKKKDEAAFD